MLNKLTVLGTGTIVPVTDRKCSGYLLDNNDELILIDCGPGILGQLTDIETDFSRLNNILITHFHYDHISDLFALILSLDMRSRGNNILNITGPEGIRKILYDAKKWLFPSENGYRPEKINITEVLPGRFKILDLDVSAEKTFHTEKSLCYRFDDRNGRSLFYSGDTEYNGNIVKLGKYADIAVVECSHSEKFYDKSGHMTWPGILKFNERAMPVKLVLTHFYEDFLSEEIYKYPSEDKNIVFANDKDIFHFSK